MEIRSEAPIVVTAKTRIYEGVTISEILFEIVELAIFLSGAASN